MMRHLKLAFFASSLLAVLGEPRLTGPQLAAQPPQAGSNASQSETKAAVQAASPAATSANSSQGVPDKWLHQVQGPSFKLDIIENSDTFSQAMAINASGQLLGVRETADETGAVFQQKYFFFDGEQLKQLPPLADFTNTEATALSDQGLVAGYASRPMGHPDGSLAAIVWDPVSGRITRLQPAAGDVACMAQDISADGTRVVGYSSGSEPARLRPCVWTRQANSDNWVPQVLSVLQDFNPFTMTSRVVISPNGTRVAACITVAVSPIGQHDSSLFMWEEQADQWNMRLVSDEQFVLRDMNDHGELAGTYTSGTGRDPCYVNRAGQLRRIGLFAGDVSGEAHAVSADGTVVGFSDDPQGPEGGPQAFVWSAGKTRALELPEGTVFSSAFGINDRGQIAGLLDVDVAQLNSPSDPPPAPEAAEPVIKTLAFRWTPQQPADK